MNTKAKEEKATCSRCGSTAVVLLNMGKNYCSEHALEEINRTDMRFLNG